MCSRLDRSLDAAHWREASKLAVPQRLMNAVLDPRQVGAEACPGCGIGSELKEGRPRWS